MVHRKADLPNSPSLNRRTGLAKPLSQIFIFCEGQTEQMYVDELASDAGRINVEVDVVGEVGVPLTVVEAAVKKVASLRLAASRRSASSFDKNYTVWAIFDKDEHPNIDKAYILANKNDVKIAFSNPCIEIWGLLHVHDLGDGEIHRHDAQRLLSKLMDDYDHGDGAEFNYGMMRGVPYERAKQRANVLLNRRQEDGSPNGNPSTDIFVLTESIFESAKLPEQRHSRATEIDIEISRLKNSPEYMNGCRATHRRISELMTVLKELK